MRRALVEALGWYGAVAILSAYALVSFSVIEAEGVWYQMLNITGGIGIVLVSLHKQAYQPAVLNIVWILIGLAALLKSIL